VLGIQTWLALPRWREVIFLVGQLYEYSHLEFSLTTNLFASAFYVLTGYGPARLIGVSAIIAVLWRSRISGHYSTKSTLV